MTRYRFLEPLDVLFFRGNRLFGDPGSFGESLMPPWPSVAAGALRSQILAEDGWDFSAFARGRLEPHPALGRPAEPGPFTVQAFHVARRGRDGAVEMLVAPPADLFLGRDAASPGNTSANTAPQVRRLRPHTLATGVLSSSPMLQVPVLGDRSRRKPAGGHWLTAQGWQRYLLGETPEATDLVPQSELWSIEPRVGVGLDETRRSAADGKLFSPQAVAFRPGVGFLVAVAGSDDHSMTGTLRLGGDGRGALSRALAFEPPKVSYATLAAQGRCRVILTTPGIFSQGWRLPGMDGDQRWHLHGVRGKVVAAALQRAEVVSGWDLAQWSPKAAERAAPTGSVYWIDELEATPEELADCVRAGLWPDADLSGPRRAEGFNRFEFAVY